MTMARDRITDLLAIAAMPGLEGLAAAIAQQTGHDEEDVLRHLLFSAWQWTTGSRNELTEMLSHSFLWDAIRHSADRVGRTLPRRPPTHNTFRFFRDGADGLGAIAAEAFVPAMRDLIRSAGLLTERAARPHSPHRTNTIFGDGTVFKPASEVTYDPETKLFNGSRSENGNPRTVDRYYGKKDVLGRAGLPVCLIGVRGHHRFMRGVLSVDTYFDRDEGAAAMRLFEATMGAYGTGVHGFAYDLLMNGQQQQKVMRAGVVPIVGMPNAATDAPGLDVPASLQEVLGTRSQPKKRAVCQWFRSVEMYVGDRVCRHDLWALDGVIVACNDGELHPSWSTAPCTQARLEFVPDDNGGQRLIGWYRIPCRHAHPLVKVDHSGDRSGAKGSIKAFADWARPIELATRGDLCGFRQDVESTFSTAKRLLALDGRAGSFDFDQFLFDIVGFGLRVNAALWDVHVAQHTDNGARAYDEAMRKRRRQKHRPL